VRVFVSPETVIGDEERVTACVVPPLLDEHLAVNVVIGAPPSSGVTKETEMRASPARADGLAGAAGSVFGVTGSDAGDAAPDPLAFVAVTVHV
jgi:hypothetical protein